MNKVLLVGRLTRDPEMRTTATGMVVTRFSVAVNHNFTDRNGERGVDYINCSAFNRQAENIAKYCKKGSLVSVEGSIRTGSYDAQDGTKRYTTDVACSQVNFLSSKNDNNTGFEPNPMPVENTYQEPEIPSANLEEDPFKSFGEEITLSSDDLPF